MHDELLNITFKPTISSTNFPVSTTFDERNRRFSQVYRNRQKIGRNNDDQIAEKYTFQPTINPVSQYICESKKKRQYEQNLHLQVVQNENISQEVDLLEKLRQAKKQDKYKNNPRTQRKIQDLQRRLGQSQRSINQENDQEESQTQITTIYANLDRHEAARLQQIATQRAYEGKRKTQQKPDQSINLEAIKYQQAESKNRNEEWLQRYYENVDQVRARRQQDIDDYKAQQDVECTFRPQLDENSRIIAKNLEPFEQKYQKYQKEHQQHLDDLYQQQLHEQLKDCTFKPELTENSDINVSTSFFERQEKLMAHKKQRQLLQSNSVNSSQQSNTELTIIKCNQFKHNPVPKEKQFLFLKDENEIEQQIKQNNPEVINYLSKIGGDDITVGNTNLQSINKVIKRIRAGRQIQEWSKTINE